ncbi:MAG: hypothetical protein H0T92_05320 [Pyrinomonadaceae bacterium]|nr:hypothetical protein [Pyrinomonadaceae bacterium]
MAACRIFFLTLAAPVLILLTTLTWAAVPGRAQCSGDDIHDPKAGYVARFVTVQARLGQVPKDLQNTLARHRGEPYSSAELTRYFAEVSSYLGENSGSAPRNEVAEDMIFGVNKLKAVSISVNHTDACVGVVPPTDCEKELGPSVAKCVDVKIRRLTVRVNTDNVSANILPFLPRSNKLTFFRQIPRPLLVFNPTFGVDHDREFGTAARIGTSINLFDLADDEVLNERNTQLLLNARGRKSLSESFYDSAASLILTRARPLKLFENVAMEASFVGTNLPHSKGKFLRNAARFGGSMNIRLNNNLFSRLNLSGAYRWSSNRLSGGTETFSESATENGFEARAITDGRIANGFAKLAVLMDSGSPSDRRNSYRRLAIVGGYQKEIPITLNQTIGVEAILGRGRAWGDIPEYARFYGGNSGGNFLYDPINVQSTTSFLGSPLLRSVGQNQAGVRRASGTVRGGTSFWHANLNVTIPIPTWSRPLIPAADESGTLNLKNALKKQVASGQPLFIIATARQRLSKEDQELLRSDESEIDDDSSLTQAQKQAKKQQLKQAQEAARREREKIKPEADRVWREITPVTNFIADYANLYSVKPLLMFDAARIDVPGETLGSPNNRTRFAIGGGLQLTVVVAKFEVGYLHSVRRAPGDDRGNFVMRLVFQNLF